MTTLDVIFRSFAQIGFKLLDIPKYTLTIYFQVLITDSMRAGCMPDGEYDLGGQTVYVKNNSARIANGSLAGSVLTLNKAVYNFKENTNLTIYEAINLASLNPAKSIKVDDKKGSLEIGKDADIAIFDKDMNSLITIVEGQIVYNKIN